MIQINELSKAYGRKLAVDNISCVIRPGMVTGFLGPNGAGKSTTMRMIVGLDTPTSGEVHINGSKYSDLPMPMQTLGVLLDAKAVHPGRSAYNHLRAMGATHGIGRKRVQEVIELTGLDSVARKRVGSFSLGMGQRLGIASALLGDPEILILDEPINGLDPDGVLWIRQLARHYAAEGRTVFLSSHLMSEMALTADHLLVVGRGRILADAPIAEILGAATTPRVRVSTPQAGQLIDGLRDPAIAVTSISDSVLEISGLTTAQVSEAATRLRVALHEITPITASLEEAYLALTRDDIEYRTEVSA